MANKLISPSKPWRANRTGRCLPAALLLLSVLVVAAGCGSSGGTDPSTNGTSQPASGAKSFAKDTKSKEITEFGQESSPSEREAASAVLSGNLKARQAADFASQCSSLGKGGLVTVVGRGSKPKAAKAECPTQLRKLAQPLSGTKTARTNTLSGPIAALRIKGSRAYALYHGNDGKDYAMPMEKESGKWLVGSITTTELR